MASLAFLTDLDGLRDILLHRPDMRDDADELAQEGLDCVAAEEGPALFILRYGNTIEGGTN